MIVLPSRIRWGVIVLALIMMVSSIMVSSRFVHENDLRITALQNDVRQDKDLIQSLWQNSLQQENRLHMLALYTALSENSDNKALQSFTNDFARQFNAQQTPEPVTIADLPDLLAKTDEEKTQALTRINQIFIETQTLETEISRLTQQNLFYMSLALFAQLMSVATITIVRDLK